jgi:pimeloyl-ACP methyl ester carboxylesterase
MLNKLRFCFFFWLIPFLGYLPDGVSQSGIQGTLYYVPKAGLDQKSIPVHYYLPNFSKDALQTQIVLHGASRNAIDYLEGWREKADLYKLALIVPEFSKEAFTISEYNQGMLIDQNDQLTDYNLFHVIDDIFEFVAEKLELSLDKFNIFGHSAGGQFVHRFMLFHNSPYVGKAVAANPGWYTYPSHDLEFPYGIKGLQSESIKGIEAFYNEELIILLGDADTLRTSNLRTSPEADAQGLHRLARGERYYELNKQRAADEQKVFRWRKVYVPNAGHDHLLMSPGAAEAIYSTK